MGGGRLTEVVPVSESYAREIVAHLPRLAVAAVVVYAPLGLALDVVARITTDPVAWFAAGAIGWEVSRTVGNQARAWVWGGDER